MPVAPERPIMGLSATHIFPVTKHNTWDHGLKHWITDRSEPELIAPNRMYSAQNGLLLAKHVRDMFDQFDFGINPDSGYRVTVFGTDMLNIGGTVLSSSTRTCDPNVRVSDNCLRWHYHQCILTHMRAAAEPVWDARGQPR
ncbi:hypothetical protein BDW62DRAFT_199039 [Aspergillus aurantiobrunneus]